MLTTVAEKWAFYDKLIALADPKETVTAFEAGRFWLMVVSSAGSVGLAQMSGPNPPPSPVGLSLGTVAQWVKSWDFSQAAVGLAAINAAINASAASLAGPKGDAFDFYQEEIKGKKVAVIGHFPYLNRYRKICDLAILERVPQPGDLPDAAAEYLLPEMDYVFVTGSAVINKTLPRLLELAEKAVVAVVGPSTPLTPLLFDYGISALAGLVAQDSPELRLGIKGDCCEGIFKTGALKINLLKPKSA
ncbi:MAG: DUF364 domain-containing protein [Deltaproteobacteria bacterium]|jgi:uncharacterized protein (DUF4213/DUF364 family)|nr:DUF364 domain-containing protein [Deltaproteobacteria bacterium]